MHEWISEEQKPDHMPEWIALPMAISLVLITSPYWLGRGICRVLMGKPFWWPFPEDE